MKKEVNYSIFALLCNSLSDLTAKERNHIAQLCIDMNQTTSAEVYAECHGIPKRTVYFRMSKNKITSLKINGAKYPSLKIIE